MTIKLSERMREGSFTESRTQVWADEVETMEQAQADLKQLSKRQHERVEEQAKRAEQLECELAAAKNIATLDQQRHERLRERAESAEARVKELEERCKSAERAHANMLVKMSTALQTAKFDYDFAFTTGTTLAAKLRGETSRADLAEATLAQRDEALGRIKDNLSADGSWNHDWSLEKLGIQGVRVMRGQLRVVAGAVGLMMPLTVRTAPAPERSGEADLFVQRAVEGHIRNHGLTPPAPEPAPKAEAASSSALGAEAPDETGPRRNTAPAQQPGGSCEDDPTPTGLEAMAAEHAGRADDCGRLARAVLAQADALPDAVKQVVGDMVQIAQAYRNSSPGLAETLERWASALSAALEAK